METAQRQARCSLNRREGGTLSSRREPLLKSSIVPRIEGILPSDRAKRRSSTRWTSRRKIACFLLILEVQNCLPRRSLDPLCRPTEAVPRISVSSRRISRYLVTACRLTLRFDAFETSTREEPKMTSSFSATAGNNSKWHASGAGYGLKVSAADRDRSFNRNWRSGTLRPVTKSRFVEVNCAKDSFWNRTCRELIASDVGRWFIELGVAPWPTGTPPRFDLSPIETGIFRVQPQPSPG